MNPYLNQYHNTLVNTSSPEQILIMLYDGAIRFIRQAEEAIVAGEKPTKAKKISKAVAIICELSNTLDHKAGGTIAEDLDSLYSFIIRELSKANLKNDTKALRTVTNLLSELKEGWVQAIEVNNTKKSEDTINKKYDSEESVPSKPFATTGL